MVAWLPVVGGIVAVVCFFVGIGILRALIRVCPPDQVLVVTGAKRRVQGKEYGFRIHKGGWTFVIPYFQSVQALDLVVEGAQPALRLLYGSCCGAVVSRGDEEPT